MSRVAVNRDVLRWAVDRSGLTTNTLRQKFPKIQDWQLGRVMPTLHQLESLASATLTPLGFFFLPRPPAEQLPIPHFRTLGDEPVSRPSPELLKTMQTMQRRQAWLHEYLIEQGQSRLSFVASARVDENYRTIAESIRRTLQFDEGWAAQRPTWTSALQVLRDAIEAAGIVVIVNGIVGNNTHRKLDPNEFRGFVLVDEYAPLLFVNGADGKAAQMFTLAHELAHVFLGSSAAFDLRELRPADDPTERACNQVAAEFLVPERELRRIWPSVRNEPEPFQAIASHFKVSALVVARRALDLSLIRRTEFLDFYNAYLADERRTAARQGEGGNFYATQNVRVSRRFARAVVRAVREDKLLYDEAYRLTGLYGKSFDRYMASLRGPQ